VTDDPGVSGATALPTELLPFGWLIGTWVGVGVLGHPTVESVNIGQEVTFASDGRPFLSYWSRIWSLDEAGNRVAPLVTESGFWRPQPGNKVEVILAHPSGHAEVWLGDLTVTGLENAVITGARVELTTDVVVRTSTATAYDAGQRLYGLVDGALLWAYDIAAQGHPMTSYCSARLTRA